MKERILEQWQYQELRNLLDDVYRRAGDAQQLRHREWRSRLESVNAGKYGLIEKKRSQVANLESQIDRDRDMLRTAKSSEFEDRVQGWIDEKLDKIRDVERFIGELQDQISEIENKLRNS